MLASDPAIENDPMSGRAHPDAQLDILDRRPPIALFVKAPESQKQITPNCAAPAPESGDISVRGVMNVMMKQVLVLREEIPLGRGIVIRADDRGDLRV